MMLTSQPTPTPTRGKSIKSSNQSLQREEAKTPEIETVFQPEPVKELKNNSTEKEKVSNGNNETEMKWAEASSLSSLSTRASKVKEYLNKTEEINAVLLKPDGRCEEIKCNASSKQINSILNGRPTIIGELEEIGVIIVRSLNQASNDKQELNKNILPPPFCNKQFYGNYLLFGVDSSGPTSLSLEQYQQFVDEKKGLTQEMRKNYNSVDNQEINIQPPKLTLAHLRSEVDKKIRTEFKNRHGRDPRDSEIEECLNKSVQDVVDNLVSMSSNRMVDPDYDPEEDEDPDYKPTEEEKKEAEKEKESEVDWRSELNDALKYVRERARFDSGILAEKISKTFYEINGVEATLNQLIEIFIRIKSEFLVEKELENETFVADNNGIPKSAKTLVHKALKRNDNFNLKMLKTPIIKSKTGIAEAYDVYFSKFNTKREEKNLLTAIESFKMRNGRQPTQFEINQLKRFLSTNNETTLVQFKLVVDENEEEEEKEKEKEKEEKENVKQKSTPSKVLVTPIKNKKNAAKFNVYFENVKLNQNRNEKQAIKWFQRFNSREPDDSELHLIKQFVTLDEKEQLIEYQYDIPVSSCNENDVVKQINYTTACVVEKKSSTKYVLHFDQKERQKGDEKQAIKWFNRFNNREPTQNEKENIKQFVQNEHVGDDQEILDID